MADEKDNRPRRPPSSRKVTSSEGSDADRDTSAAPATDRPRRTTPFWRRGWFWVGVIAVEVVVALVLSFGLERSTSEVDLSGGDLAAFCAKTTAFRSETAAQPGAGEATDVGDPAPFIRERDAYLALVPVAPPDIVADLEKLAALDDELIETVTEIGARKAEDPSYDGLSALTDAVDRLEARGRVAATRVDLALLRGCGISSDDVAPTTAGGPLVTVTSTTAP